ncbi:MAG: glycosyltransferase family 4 protein [Rhodanobacteraceae bacterium]|nr:MAG: glycosyltransferase family 4 protein [Rhodanobacteraceae bacterium]
MTTAALLGLVVAAALALSMGVTRVALAYARRRGLLDQPGRRRSHTTPTPRGGGIGVVAAVVLIGIPAWCITGAASGWWQPAAVTLAVLAVALIGWRDDHVPLPVLPRLAVHAGAALLVAAAILAPPALDAPARWWFLLPLALLLAAFINAHNFMDGIDGLLGQQGLFVLLGIGVLAAWLGAPGVAVLAFAGAAGCLGFLFYNLPPARIFMGDVGSGALGLVLGASAALLVRRFPGALWACAILPSAFLVDSGLTLLHRVLAGQRWYAPHRQHLYQWLVRVNWSHARTDGAYMLWNLLLVAPLAWLAARWPHRGAWCALAAYAATGVVWYLGKRACLAVVRWSAYRETA